MYGKTLTLALLCSLSVPALAAPQHDPANIDAGGGGDPAYVFSHQPAQRAHRGSMPLVDRIASSGKESLGETWDRLTGPSADDYQQAYGNANIRDRFARGYGYARDGSTLSLGGSGNWLGQMLQGGRSQALLQDGQGDALLGNGQSLQGAMDAMSRQLLPLVREFKDNIDTAIEQGQRRR